MATKKNVALYFAVCVAFIFTAAGVAIAESSGVLDLNGTEVELSESDDRESHPAEKTKPAIKNSDAKCKTQPKKIIVLLPSDVITSDTPSPETSNIVNELTALGLDGAGVHAVPTGGSAADVMGTPPVAVVAPLPTQEPTQFPVVNPRLDEDDDDDDEDEDDDNDGDDDDDDEDDDDEDDDDEDDEGSRRRR